MLADSKLVAELDRLCSNGISTANSKCSPSKNDQTPINRSLDVGVEP